MRNAVQYLDLMLRRFIDAVSLSVSNMGAGAMRGLLTISVLLTGCANAPGTSSIAQAPTPNWTLENSADRITGRKSVTLDLNATTAKYSGTVLREGAASASILCLEKGVEVMFAFDFPVGLKNVAVLSYRFDQKPGQQLASDFFNMQTPLIRDKKQVATFLSQAVASNKLYVRVSSPTGLAEAEFNTGGGEAVIRSFQSQCPQAI